MKEYFKSRQDIAREQELAARKRVDLLSVLRLIAFLLTAGCAWFWFQQKGSIWPWAFLVSTISFLVLMRLQQSAQRLYRFYKNIVQLNQDEAKRLDFEFVREDSGSVFQDSRHFYSGDLDIFGKHSLFRLLNRTQTSEGSARLAYWLSNPAPLETILERQQALSESKKEHEWRENWQATALLYKNSAQQVGSLTHWINSPMEPHLVNGLKWKWWAIITISLLVGWALGFLPGWPLGFSIVIHLLILRRYSKYIKQLIDETLDIGSTLVAYADLMAVAKKAKFKSPWWEQQLSAASEGETAFRELGTWFSRLDFRGNAYFTLFIGIPVFWDLICLDGLEKWKEKYKEKFPDWLNSLANIEAMNSLAGHAFANPDQVLPEVTWGNELEIICHSLGHPLIPTEKRVCNDFELSGTGKTVLITGSNMSGKSTFLRTIGLNLVMAQTGGVVVAKSMSSTLMQVFTSMRTQDSLEENTSSFYAELKRLKQLIELAESGGEIPVFFLLDEILKGTNSADRHRGAAALIKQLHPINASGIVSTHDVELGVWGEHQAFVQNFNFSSDLSDGKINFDYKLTPGTCTSFNASELMRMMGIKLDGDSEK